MRERMEENYRAPTFPDRREYQSQLHTLEHDFLFGPSMARREVAKRTTALRSPAMPQQEMLDFFEAVSAHESANQYRAAFLAYLGRESRARNTSPTAFTREETAELFNNWPEHVQLEEEENTAMGHYEEAVESTWKGDRVNDLDAKMLFLDLKARHAARMKDSAIREKAARAYEKELQALIPYVKPAGKRTEYELLWLIRRWTREADQDHMVSIEHALPKDDLAHGIDFVLTVGDEIANIQLKAPPEGGAASTHHQEKIEKAKQALIGKAVNTVVIGYEAVREAFNLQTMEPQENTPVRLQSLQVEILETLEKQIKGKHEALIQMIRTLKAESQPKEKPKQLSRQQLERNTSLSTLRAFGLLTEKEEHDLAAILEIKKRFFEASRGLIKTPGDLKSPPPELIQKVRRAAGQWSEA